MSIAVNLCDLELARVMIDESVLSTERLLQKEPTAIESFMLVSDLPVPGNPDVLYKNMDTCDLVVWTEAGYKNYNPYAPEGQRITELRPCITDDTAMMPTGGVGPLAVVYNVHAFRRDLYTKGVMNWTYRDMVPQGIIGATDDLRTQQNKFFKHSHKALMNQIRMLFRKNGKLVHEYTDALKRIGIDVWYTNHEFGFKDGDFVAVFA